MSARATIRRSLLLATVLPLAGFGAYQWNRSNKAARYYEEVYAAVDSEMHEYRVIKLMGSDGSIVSPEGWPRTVEEIPGYIFPIPPEADRQCVLALELPDD